MYFNMRMTVRTSPHTIAICFFFGLAATTPLFAQDAPDADPVLRLLQPSAPAHPSTKICFEGPAAEADLSPDSTSPLPVDTPTETAKDRAEPPIVGSESPPDRWPWRRAGIAEYTLVPVVAAGTLYYDSNGRPDHPNWTNRNGFDETVRRALRVSDRSAREACSTASDVFMGVMIAAPIVDSFATLGVRDARWDSFWQTTVINAESFIFTGLVSSLMENLLARERPFQRDCVDGNCEFGDLNRSMPSGHAAFAFTGAGLMCTHHEYQSLYGDPGADRAVCASALGVSAVTGVLRILSDTHYATDVLAGSAIGLFSGFVLPRVLHYYWGSDAPPKKEESAQWNGEAGERLTPVAVRRRGTRL